MAFFTGTEDSPKVCTEPQQNPHSQSRLDKEQLETPRSSFQTGPRRGCEPRPSRGRAAGPQNCWGAVTSFVSLRLPGASPLGVLGGIYRVSVSEFFQCECVPCSPGHSLILGSPLRTLRGLCLAVAGAVLAAPGRPLWVTSGDACELSGSSGEPCRGRFSREGLNFPERVCRTGCEALGSSR